MGVLACHRNSCEKIMCDRLSPEHGYICYECFNELVSKGPEVNISLFMASKKPGSYNKEEAYARYDAAFPDGDE